MEVIEWTESKFNKKRLLVVVSVGSQWQEPSDPEDDIFFVVVQVK